MSDSLREERLARAALCRLGEPGEPRLAGVVRQMGGTALYETLTEERALDGSLTDLAVRLRGLDPERDLRQAERLGIRFVVPGDDEWPSQLDDLDDCAAIQEQTGRPLGLWVRGPLRLDEIDPAVAVVGSRSATTYGVDVAGAIGSALAGHGVTVVSGAAFGIDQAAHRGALAGRGATVAVLACGVDRPYPQAHKELIEYVAAHGAVVSELAPGCSPTRYRFLARNRVIAALCRGTVVVEAAIRSGALNTANWTDRLSRQLMGVPGSVNSAASQGVHQLIRTGAATLVTTGEEVLELVGERGVDALADPRAPVKARDRLPSRDGRVLEAVPVVRAATVDAIARTAGIALLGVQSALIRLERDGFVEQESGGWRLGRQGREE